MKKISTGIAGLDEMLGGGFPEGRIILVCGGPGTGKTIFSFQFLVEGAKGGEKGVYITLEEPLELVKTNISSFGWEFDRYCKEKRLKLLDSNEVAYGVSPEKTSLEHIFKEIKDFKAGRIVIDPINSITLHQTSASKKRQEIAQIFKKLRGSNLTAVITMEDSSLKSDFYMEEYLADGVILLAKTIDQKYKLIKTIRIEKMRGTRHDEQPRRYEITDKGLTVYNTEEVIY